MSKSKMVTGYKFITSDMRSKNGYQTWIIRKWVKYKGKLVMCESGLHGCESALDSLNYVYGEKWFKVEARGEILRGDDKFDASEMSE